MRLSGNAWMTFAFMLVSIGVIISAVQWPIKAALFPISVGVPVFFLSMVHFISCFKRKDGKVDSGLDFKLTEMEDKALGRKRTIHICLWILGLFFMILLIGFPIAVPLFMFLYMKLQGKEKWRTSIALTVVAWGAFYGLFVKFCSVLFGEGWIQQGLAKLGIL